MKVILTQNVSGQGKAGDLLEVSDGYARNFLIKRGFAKPADAQALTEKKAKEASEAFRLEEKRKEMQQMADRLNGEEIIFYIKAGDNGKLFGSVTAREIATDIRKRYSMPIDKRKIQIGEIKTFGVFPAEIKFMPGITAKIKVNVAEEK